MSSFKLLKSVKESFGGHEVTLNISYHRGTDEYKLERTDYKGRKESFLIEEELFDKLIDKIKGIKR